MIKIATASNRKSKTWKNEEQTWADIVDRLSNPVRTDETMAEYMEMAKSERAEIKDVGGYVGGWLKEGRRKSGHVDVRSLITLDIDFADDTLKDELELIHGLNGVLVTTHSHTPEQPKYRLILPLDREVNPEEYQAIARRIADDIGMEQFDPTTYQPERMMYWSSAAIDGEFECLILDGDVLDADGILAQYDDWNDTSQWPLHESESQIKSVEGKMEDPTQKKGIIGAFCKVYSISKAIDTFLSDIYVAGSVDGRYTYTDASTTDGLVVYGDMYAHSHHSTDPLSGRSVNAWDMVRIHLFGDLDKDKEYESPSKAPSYKKMKDMAAQEYDVKLNMYLDKTDGNTIDFETYDDKTDNVEEKATNTQEDDEFGFALYDDGEEPEQAPKNKPEDPKAWIEEVNLRFTDTGKMKLSPFNRERILENDPNLAGRIGFNEFNETFEKTEKMEWDFEYKQEWTDNDTHHLQSYLDTVYDVTFSPDSLLATLAVTSTRNNRFHPVKDFIRSEEWDGEKRLEMLFVDYLGAKDSDYTREVTRLWFAAAVARIYKPGIKFDYVPILESVQGVGKTKLLEKMSGTEELDDIRSWYSSGIKRLDGNKEDLQNMSRIWIAELGELTAMSNTDVNAMKQFITSRVDMYRPPYGRQPVVQRRRTVFIGSTNTSGYLKDTTGNRRWLPIVCNKRYAKHDVEDGTLDPLVGQLWAEAYNLFMTDYSNGRLDLSDEAKVAALEAQRGAEAADVVKMKTEEYLNIDKPKDWHKWSKVDQQTFLIWANDKYTNANIDKQGGYSKMELEEQTKMTPTEVFENIFQDGFTSKDSDSATIQKIGTIMMGIDGWEKKQFRTGGSVKWGYVKVPTKKKVGASK